MNVQEPNTGGIDLTASYGQLQVQNPNGEIKFDIDPAMLAQIEHSPGFTPLITSMEPIEDVPQFLGATPTQ